MRGVVQSTLIASWLVLASGTSARAQEGLPAVPPGYETAAPPGAPAPGTSTAPPPGTAPPDTSDTAPPPTAPPPTPPGTVVVVPAYGTPGYGASAYGAQAPAQGQMVVAGAPIGAPRARAVEVERSESIRALWLPGLIALPVAWLSTWTAASTYFVGDALTYAWIPVIGPWLMLTQDLNGYEAPVVISGIVQGAATLMIVLGLSLRRTYTATEYVLEPPPITFDVAPMPGGGYGSVTLRM